MTTQISVASLDGGGNALAIRADQNVDNSIAFRSSAEVGGAAVSAANPMPIGVPALTYMLSTAVSVGTTSGAVVAAAAAARALQISTLPASTTNVWLNPTGGAAVVGSGVLVPAGGGSVNFGTAALPMPTTTITGITDGSASQNVTVVGG